MNPLRPLIDGIFSLIFWLWNLVFLAAVYAGVLPFLTFPLAQAVLNGEVEPEFLVTLMLLLLVPGMSVFLGWTKFRQQPSQLLGLFYGVEAPLMLALTLRLFVLRELTPASTLVVGTSIVCMMAFLLELLFGYARDNKWLARLQLGVHSVMFLGGLSVAAILMFYAVPVGWALLREFFRFAWLESLWWMLTNYPLGFLTQGMTFMLLFGLTASLFVAMPLALAMLYSLSGLRIATRFGEQYGYKRARQGAIAVAATWVLMLTAFNQQPQLQAFRLLEQPVQTQAQRQELLQQSDRIRKGLVHAHLSSHRYVTSTGTDRHIFDLYQSNFGLPESLCELLQRAYHTLMSPFVYRGSFLEDIGKAEKLYGEFFDVPLQRAERKAVRHALKSTALLDQAKAGLANIEEERVWLRQQQVNVQPQGNWAAVELYEVYENKTEDVEEIFYYFSLPESAVITGLWLGDTANRDARFEYVIAPRGAAQKVYNDQVQRARPVDPALLEQVGPQQYRLRAFPIPAPLTSWERNSNVDRPTEMHLWLTYQVMQQPEGWALPKLRERRNIYWTEQTERTYNGKQVKDGENWLPDFLPAEAQAPTTYQVTFADGNAIAATPLPNDKLTSPQGKRLALVLDTSRSMGDRRQALSEALQWWQQHAQSNDADLYLTGATGIDPQRLDDPRQFQAKDALFYGTIQLKEMLRQFHRLQGNTAYDAIVLLSDEGSYELTDNNNDMPAITTPVWIVHLNGDLAPAYDDAILQVLQRGGGAAGSLPEALQRLATLEAQGADTISVADGYVWKLARGEGAATSDSDGFAPFAARQLIKALSQRMDAEQLSELDAIHAIAKQVGIVSPYSSALVLVNDEQRQALKEAEAAGDRFDREVEDGKESLNPNLNPANIPEPTTILGSILMAVLIMVMRRQQRLA